MKERLRLSTLLGALLLMVSVASAARVLTIPGTGDSQFLLRDIAREFQRADENTDLSIQIPDSIGSGGGIKAILNGDAELARTARPLKQGEAAAGLQQYRFALSPIVFVVHPSIRQITNLSTEQIIGIYSGQYRNWRELGGPNAKIYAVDREPGDSSRTNLENRMPSFADTDSVAKLFYTTPEAAQAIANHRYTIGFLPATAAKHHGLQTIAIDGVTPNEANILNGSYPYATPFFLVTKRPASTSAQRIIEFLFTERAQHLMRLRGAVPIEAENPPDASRTADD